MQDHLNSSNVFVNQPGSIVTTNYYYPYGGNRGATAFNFRSSKRFTSQYHESSLPGGEGLSYYGARWYDAKLGRFLSADTIVPGPANPQAFNRYSYVYNTQFYNTLCSTHKSAKSVRPWRFCQSFGKGLPPLSQLDRTYPSIQRL